MVRIILALGIALCLPVSPRAQGWPARQGPTLLLHGNYCGPGNRAPLPPIDLLDAACARHDACTPRGGPPSAACNTRLQREASAIANDPRLPSDLRGTAGMIALGASLLPSDPRASAPWAAAPALPYSYAPALPGSDLAPSFGAEPDDEDD